VVLCGSKICVTDLCLQKGSLSVRGVVRRLVPEVRDSSQIRLYKRHKVANSRAIWPDRSMRTMVFERISECLTALVDAARLSTIMGAI
jgi:hypothetical protein